MTVPCQLTPGAPRHGVVRHARELAETVGERLGRTVPLEVGQPLGGGPLHLHFTDRIWGADPAAAAARVEALGVPFTVTFHDLPQASDGPRNLPRRIDAYRRVARAARAVACSSHHEAALLRDVVGVEAEPLVVPLWVIPRAPAHERPPAVDEVALLGFVYPGKGHAEAIAAAAGTGLSVTALGRAADGHEADVAALTRAAAARGVRFEVTGYLDEAELLARCRRAAVPLAAHAHVSGSGSVGSWIGASRRPLVPDTRYSREIAALRPGTVTLYASEDLGGAVARARLDPDGTWLAHGTPTAPHLADAADAYLAWWSGVAW